MAKEIDLTQGKKAIVDDEDYEWLSQWKWYYSKGYAVRHSPRIFGERHTIYMHREIMKTPDDMGTDHIDRDRLNNQRRNLRVCSFAENMRNQGMRADNTSGYKGVHWCKQTRKWLAKIGSGGREIHLGRFDDIADAVLAYDEAALKFHGKFAVLNKVG